MNSYSRLPSYLCLSALVGLFSVLSVPRTHSQEANAHHLPKRIVADYVYWSKNQSPAYSAAQIPFHELTHINHAGISFYADGTLSVPDGYIEPELNNRAHAAGVKVMVLMGGDFYGLENSGAIQKLVANAAAFAKQYHYDGFDVDWEYPETRADRRILVQLMDLLRKENPNYVLSIDVAPWAGYGYDLANLALSLTYFNIMMYDCAGPWTAYGQFNSPIFWNWHDPAPYECQPGGSVHDTANIFLKHVPAAQLNMGTPFYGYYYTNINQRFGLCPNSLFTADGACDNQVETVGYASWVKPHINKDGWQTLYDPVSFVPYMLRIRGSDGFVTYDDAFSTYFRVWYADWDRGMGGTFMWSLDADYDGHSQDLLDAMYQASVFNH